MVTIRSAHQIMHDIGESQGKLAADRDGLLAELDRNGEVPTLNMVADFVAGIDGHLGDLSGAVIELAAAIAAIADLSGHPEFARGPGVDIGGEDEDSS